MVKIGKLAEYVEAFGIALYQQIKSDEKRWGDTWRYRPIVGQVDRMMARFRDYHDQYIHGPGEPFPWLKVAGEALIGWVRENNPDYYLEEERDDGP